MTEQAVKLTIFVSPEVYSQLSAEAAERRRRSVPQYVATLLERHCAAASSPQMRLFAFGGREGVHTEAQIGLG